MQTGSTVTCPRGTIRPGDTIAQAVELKAPATASPGGAATVEVDLLFSEDRRTLAEPKFSLHPTWARR